jgi:hypothetical protein
VYRAGTVELMGEKNTVVVYSAGTLGLIGEK